MVQCRQFGHAIQGRGLQDHLRAQYRLPSTGRAANLKFSPCGEQFGCIEAGGSLCLWRFQSGADVPLPFSRLQCHGRKGADLCFVGSSVVLATVGASAGQASPSLCVWDVLLPPSQALITSCAAHAEGGCCVLHSPADMSLISGGQKGEVAIFDLRQQRQRQVWNAHSLAARSLALDGHALFSGSSDGDIKLWDLSRSAASAADLGRSSSFEDEAGSGPSSNSDSVGAAMLMHSWPRCVASGRACLGALVKRRGMGRVGGRKGEGSAPGGQAKTQRNALTQCAHPTSDAAWQGPRAAHDASRASRDADRTNVRGREACLGWHRSADQRRGRWRLSHVGYFSHEQCADDLIPRGSRSFCAVRANRHHSVLHARGQAVPSHPHVTTVRRRAVL